MKKLQIQTAFITNALRNCGYNSYTAIADIIDNSLEPNVESSFVKVFFETENGTTGSNAIIKSILIVDDGVGMTMETLDEAMSLGSQTGKNGITNLGLYGTGLKSASLSIGQVLEVYTKKQNTTLHYAKLSIEDALLTGNDIMIDLITCSENTDEYEYFQKYVGNTHGTIIKITNLDRISTKNLDQFKGTLKNKIGETFNKFICNKVVKMYVDNVEVPYVEMMSILDEPHIIGEGNLEVDGHNIKYRAYYIPKNENEREDKFNVDNTKHISRADGSECIGRFAQNQGLYIYRNNRLVGKALTLGLWSRHSTKNGFRCELFMDGTCDYLFGSTFTKIIMEKERNSVDQSFRDKLSACIGPYINDVYNRQQRETHDDSDPEAKKQQQNFYKGVTDTQNRNMMLSANRKEKHEETDKTDENKVNNGTSKRNRASGYTRQANRWLGGFDERHLGATSEMYSIEHENTKPIVVINKDHAFYKEFYSRLEDNMKFVMAQVISCDEIAKQMINYYGSPEIHDYIDCYELAKAHEVMKSLQF